MTTLLGMSSEKILARIISIVWIASVVSGTSDFSKDEEIMEADWFSLH